MKILAPWTEEQVGTLNQWQASGHVHPFTCRDRGDEAHRRHAVDTNARDIGVLVATIDGWTCPVCDYKQNWAHDFMLGALFVKAHGPFEAFIDCGLPITESDANELVDHIVATSELLGGGELRVFSSRVAIHVKPEEELFQIMPIAGFDIAAAPSPEEESPEEREALRDAMGEVFGGELREKVRAERERAGRELAVGLTNLLAFIRAHRRARAETDIPALLTATELDVVEAQLQELQKQEVIRAALTGEDGTPYL